MSKWIEVNIPFGPVYDENEMYDPMDSMDERGLLVPGTIIDIGEGSKREELLIGHINPKGGVCEGCSVFGDDEIVHRYKIIWKEK